MLLLFYFQNEWNSAFDTVHSLCLKKKKCKRVSVCFKQMSAEWWLIAYVCNIIQRHLFLYLYAWLCVHSLLFFHSRVRASVCRYIIWNSYTVNIRFPLFWYLILHILLITFFHFAYIRQYRTAFHSISFSTRLVSHLIDWVVLLLPGMDVLYGTWLYDLPLCLSLVLLFP